MPNRKQSCVHDYCDCPCHKGKTIGPLGQKMTHPPGQCPCRPCPICKKQVKNEAAPEHLNRCPENPNNGTRAIEKEKAEKAKRAAEEAKRQAEQKTKKIGEQTTRIERRPPTQKLKWEKKSPQAGK